MQRNQISSLRLRVSAVKNSFQLLRDHRYRFNFE
jgi:hypothetical protein